MNTGPQESGVDHLASGNRTAYSEGRFTQPAELDCNGACMERAQAAFAAAAQAAQSTQRDQFDINKRFQFLRDVAATDPHKEAEILFEHALALCELIYGQEHPAVASMMLNLAATYSMHGRKDSAAYLIDWANEILSAPKQEPVHEFFHLFGLDDEKGQLPLPP